jgi:parvulin-like peptidyl-prolyl isomerase
VLSLKQAVPTLQSVSQPVAQWLGPIRSAFGLHYVWLNALEPARDARLKEVEPQLRRDLDYAAQAQALQNAINLLRKNYDIRRPNIEDLEGKTIEAPQ